MIVEVKQLDPNKDESQNQKRLINGDFVVTESTPGARVRSKIHKAGSQLRKRSKGKIPTILSTATSNEAFLGYTSHKFVRYLLFDQTYHEGISCAC